MPNQTKDDQKRGVPAAGGLVTAPKKAVVSKPAAGGYTHFSDRMTAALMNINDVIDENKGTLDSIQDMALELTLTIRVLKVVVLKYVDMVDNILEAAVPIMERMPIFPASVKEFARDALALAKKINTAGELAERVLPGVEASLMSADVSGLQASTKDVASLTRALQDITLTAKK